MAGFTLGRRFARTVPKIAPGDCGGLSVNHLHQAVRKDGAIRGTSGSSHIQSLYFESNNS